MRIYASKFIKNSNNTDADILNFFKILEQFVEEHEEVFAAQVD